MTTWVSEGAEKPARGRWVWVNVAESAWDCCSADRVTLGFWDGIGWSLERGVSVTADTHVTHWTPPSPPPGPFRGPTDRELGA